MDISVKTSNSANLVVDVRNTSGVSFPLDSKMDVEYVDGKKEGKAIVRSSKGTRLAILNYSYDKLEGHCILFDSTGKKEKEAIFSNGLHNGWGCEFADSKPVFTGFYENGERWSELKLLNKDGYYEEVRHGKTLSFCKLSSNHKRDGLNFIYSNGNLKKGVLYDDGSIIKLVFDIKGIVR